VVHGALQPEGAADLAPARLVGEQGVARPGADPFPARSTSRAASTCQGSAAAAMAARAAAGSA
jgi:hypothetical protein